MPNPRRQRSFWARIKPFEMFLVPSVAGPAENPLWITTCPTPWAPEGLRVIHAGKVWRSFLNTRSGTVRSIGSHLIQSRAGFPQGVSNNSAEPSRGWIGSAPRIVRIVKELATQLRRSSWYERSKLGLLRHPRYYSSRRLIATSFSIFLPEIAPISPTFFMRSLRSPFF